MHHCHSFSISGRACRQPNAGAACGIYGNINCHKAIVKSIVPGIPVSGSRETGSERQFMVKV